MKYFGQINSEGKAVIGLSKAIEINKEGEQKQLIEKLDNIGKASVGITFTEIEVNDTVGSDGGAQSVRTAVERAREAWLLLQRKCDVGESFEAVVCELTYDGYIYVEPESDILRRIVMDFAIPYNQYMDMAESFSVHGKLKEGDRILVIPHLLSDNRIVCRFSSRIEGERAEQAKRERKLYDRLNDLRRQLAPQVGKVFVSVKPGEAIVTPKGLTIHPLTFQQISNIAGVFPDKLKPELTAPDGSVRLFLQHVKPDNKNPKIPNLILESGIRIKDVHKYSPERKPEVERMTVEGVVTGTDVVRNLIMAYFDNYTWGSGFLAYTKDGKPRFKHLWDDAKAYYPIGYTCKFTLMTELETGKCSLRLLGIDPALDGRMPLRPGEYFGEKPTVRYGSCSECEMMSPVCVRGNELMMCSPDYTAFMPIGKDFPSNLRSMVEAGVYSPEYRIPCEVSLIKPNNVGDGKLYKVVCRPVTDPGKLRHALPRAGEKVEARMVAALDGVMFMMIGEVAAICRVPDKQVFMGLLEGTLKASAYRVKTVSKGEVEIVPEGVHPAVPVVEGLEAGSLFKVGEKMTYNGVPVVNMPDSQPVKADSAMLCLGVDPAQRTILATSRLSSLYYYLTPRKFRVDITETPVTAGVLVGRCDDGNIVPARLEGGVAEMIIGRLKRVYRNGATMVVSAGGPGNRLAGWSGIACQHDYSNLLGDSIPADVAALWDELPDPATPVLFGDILVRRGDLPAIPERKSGDERPAATSVPGLQLAKVSSSVTKRSMPPVLRVVFEGGITVEGAANLRINFPTASRNGIGIITDLEEIFPRGSEWKLEQGAGGEWKIAVDHSSAPRPYEVMAPVTSGKKETHCVVRSDIGTIAIAQKDGLPERSMMALSHYDEESGVLHVRPAEEHFIGKKLCLRIDSVEAGYLRCSEITGRIKRPVHIPLDRVSWNPAWHPDDDLCGAACKARVTAVEDNWLVADRRCLLRQDALLEGVVPQDGAIYQMEVTGRDAGAYLLEQNGVRAHLPFRYSALFNITSESEDFLLPGDLVDVQLSKVREGSSALVADRIPMLSDRVDALRQMAAEEDTAYSFTVHHISPEGLFVERDGEVLFADIRNLGGWKGNSDALTDEYPVGAVIDLYVQEVREGKFRLFSKLDVPDSGVPAVGDRLHGCVSSIHPGRGCYVRFNGGMLAAFVPEHKMSWRPLRANHDTGLHKGDTVDFIIEKIDKESRTIYADIRGTSAEPSRQEYCGPHHIARVAGYDSDADSWLMVDDRGYVIRLPYSETFEREMESYLGGFGIVPVTGVNSDGTLAGDMTPQADAVSELREKFRQATDNEPLQLRVRILEVQANKLLVTAGYALGNIPRSETDTNASEKLASRYKVGDEVDVIVTDTKFHYNFVGSISRHRRFLARREVEKMAPGQTVKVKIMAADSAGVTARCGAVDVRIPAAQVTRDSGTTPKEWAESREGMTVEVVILEISADARITASRTAALAEGVCET